MSQYISPHTQNYFHGKITREQAEEILLNRGGTDGSFLLRESVNNNFAVSICHNNRVHHYNIERQLDGTYQIPTGRRFASPVELVRHHSQHLDGFLTLARFPVERSPAMSYFVLQGVTASDLEERLRLKAVQMGLKGSNSIEEALGGPMREHLRQLVLQDLHHCQPWFHECIRRSDAENRLQEAGHTEGQFLVRYRKDDNSYVLSLSFQGQPKHYKINCNLNKLQIEGGQFFNTLIEMIDNYHFRQDGLLCKLRYPVESPRYQRSRSGANSTASRSLSGASTPSSLPLVGEKSTPPQIRNNRPSNAMNPNQGPLPTFSSESSSGSSCTGGNVTTNPWGIPGPETKSPADLISFSEWSNMSSFLNANASSQNSMMTPMNIIATNNIFMTSSGSNPNTTQVFHSQGASAMITPFNLNRDQGIEISSNFSTGFTPTPTPGDFNVQQWHTSNPIHNPLSIRINQTIESFEVHSQSSAGKSSLSNQSPKSTPNQSKHSSNQGLNQPSILDEAWEEPDLERTGHISGVAKLDISSVSPRQIPKKTHSNNCHFLNDLFSDNTQVIYDALPLDDDTFNLEPSQISIKDKLGGGNFGHVFGGIYSPSNGDKEVPVAIKMLKQDQVSNVNQEEIMTEARVMAQLKHRHIVRLIGVCKDVQVMLVLEIAPLGPINKYLRKNVDMNFVNITELMYQVALGMAYLEVSKFVHRDLAARNVLLVNEKYAKISDFGMSKALKFGNDYYRAANAGKWPIKWYAPECIYYFRFDSKSDVWSYGVTLWEVFSYGDRPYRDMKGTQILSMIDRGKRLNKPPGCPDCIYDVMLQCWEFDGVRRPTFAELVMIISRILNNFHTGKSGNCSSAGSGEGYTHSGSSATK